MSLPNRQGCKHGFVIFNLGYVVALARIRVKLRQAGVTFEHGRACAAGLDVDGEQCIAVTCVDDETAIRLAMCEVAQVFTSLGFEVVPGTARGAPSG